MSITATPLVAGYRLSRPEAADAAEWSEFQALPLFKQHTSSTIESATDLLPIIERSLSSDPAAPVQAVARALVGLPKPVVAVVHGWTVGAGLEWALNADLVVAAADARFKLPEASIGVFVTGGLTATLPACAGLARAKALMLLGEEFSSSQAQSWGLVWRVVPDDELEAESRRVAGKLAALQPEVASRFKRVLNDVGLPALLAPSNWRTRRNGRWAAGRCRDRRLEGRSPIRSAALLADDHNRLHVSAGARSK